MYTNNNKKNCQIFNGTLFQDLQDYSLFYNDADINDANVYIRWGNQPPASAVAVSQTVSTSHNIFNILNIPPDTPTGIWKPCIIDPTTRPSSHTRTFEKQVVNNSRIIGITDFIYFNGSLKNWSVLDNSGLETSPTMVTDWNITSPVPSFEAYYGLLCWYKIDAAVPKYKLSDIPNGSIIKPNFTISLSDGSVVPNGISFVKLSNSKLKRSDKRSNIILGSSISFWNEKEILDLNQASFNIEQDLFSYDTGDNSRQHTQGEQSISLWISDGEAFSYFDSPTDRKRSISREIPSKTYLSPILMPIYREIKNKFLKYYGRSVSSSLGRKKALLLQKLAYFLSTFPLIDRVSIDIPFNDDLNTYLTSSVSSRTSEIDALSTIISTISSKYKNQSLTDKVDSKNYIETKKDLIEKLLFKYGSKMVVYAGYPRTLKYKNPIKNGAHGLIGIDSHLRINNSYFSSSGTYYTNCSISLGNLHYITQISNTGSIVHLSGTNSGGSIEVPLVDISVKKDSPGIFNLGTDRFKQYVGPEIVVQDLYPFGDIYNTTYFWEQVSGPECIRFSDYNKDRFGQSRFVTSSDSNPSVYIRSSGTYEIRCTKTTEGFVDSDSLVVTTSPNETLTSPDLSDITTPAYPKIINGIPRRIGFNKHGMIWIADTENYVTDDYTYKPTSDFGILNTHKLKDIRIDLSKSLPLSVVNSNADLYISISPENNTSVVVNAFNIENARYDSEELSQCVSLYDEKIYRDPVNPMAPILGTANFARDIEQEYRFVYYTTSGASYPRETSSCGPPSIISTKLSPPIKAYGGYKSTKIDTIGISMPGHPTSSTLPKLNTRNNIVSPDPTGLHCFLREVDMGGGTIDFAKGFFNPQIGWVFSSGTPYNNTSCVVSDDISKQHSYVFKGAGFFNLRPSFGSGSINIYNSTIRLNLDTSYNAYNQHNQIYGYRTYNEDQRFDHNFVVNVDKNYWFDPSGCGRNEVSYSFPVTGILGTKKIQDLEVKLNFLNYPDPGNLVVWLDVYNANISGSTSNPSHLYSSAGLNGVNTGINDMNYQMAGFGRIYLLNQEHISNYENNFSITFSDRASKYKSTNKNTDEFNDFHSYNDTINNNDTIQPTLVPTGIFTPLDMAVIKNNQVNSVSNYFAKFKGATLDYNSSFVLNIGVVNPFEYTNKILDDLSTNNIAKSLNSDTVGSTNIANSLCSWDVIIHTDSSSRYANSDVLGKINYTDFMWNPSGSVSGYNFIANFSGIEYLLPQVNLNAPYHYLANVNSCFYNQDGVGDSWSFIRPSYNENMRNVSLGIMRYLLAGANAMGGAAFGAVGGLMGLYALQSVYEQGGRSDPLINFFIETGLLDQTEAQDSQYYKPVYSKKFFGLPDRALLAISTDGVYWYNVDVPIFKLSNTPVLQKNKYKYIKLIGNQIPGISSFDYKVIVEYRDLDLAPVVHRFVNNTTLSGLLSGNNNSRGSLVLVEGQTVPSENGYYIVSDGGWTKVPSAEKYFLRYNRINGTFNHTTLSSKTHILIDGYRPFNFFDIGETISLSNALGVSSSIVVSKSFIMTSTGVKTVLTLSSPIAQDGIVYKDSANANVLLLHKTDYNSVGQDTENTWMLEKTRNEKGEVINPVYHHTAYGEGSIGYGIDLLDPDILRRLTFHHSEILETNKILNNHENDLYKFNSVFVETTGAPTVISFDASDTQVNLLKGYSYRPREYLNKPLYDREENTNLEKDMLRNSIIDKEFSNHYFMEIKSDKFKTTITEATGYLYIEGDHKRVYPVRFTDTDINMMRQRVAYLAATGIPAQYSIYQTATDSANCFNSYSESSCPKSRAYQEFRLLEQEKNRLLDALSLPRCSADVSYIIGNVVYSGGFNAATTPLKLNFIIDNFSYWINIDPEQVCSLNDELSVKVLESIEMKAIPISSIESEGIVPGENSHIVPTTSSTGILNGINVSLLKEGLVYKYEIAPSAIQAYKDLWPDVNWGVTDNFTYGTTSTAGDSKKIMINKLNSHKDMLVCIQENYIRPSGLAGLGLKKVKDIINLDTKDSIIVKFRNVPRKIKGIDSENFEKYVYDRHGNLIKSSRPPSSVGQIANNFTCWHCINSSGEYISSLPPYYKLANEMRYRAFYGSVDGIENTNTIYSDSKNDWEWIPYEYYNPITSSATAGPRTATGAIMGFLISQSQNTTISTNNSFSIMEYPPDFFDGDFGGSGKITFFVYSIKGFGEPKETSPGKFEPGPPIRGRRLGIIRGNSIQEAQDNWYRVLSTKYVFFNIYKEYIYGTMLVRAPDSYEPTQYILRPCGSPLITCENEEDLECVEETDDITEDRLWDISFEFYVWVPYNCCIHGKFGGHWYTEPAVRIAVAANGAYFARYKVCTNYACSWGYDDTWFYTTGTLPIADMYKAAYFEMIATEKELILLKERVKEIEKLLSELNLKLFAPASDFENLGLYQKYLKKIQDTIEATEKMLTDLYSRIIFIEYELPFIREEKGVQFLSSLINNLSPMLESVGLPTYPEAYYSVYYDGNGRKRYAPSYYYRVTGGIVEMVWNSTKEMGGKKQYYRIDSLSECSPNSTDDVLEMELYQIQLQASTPNLPCCPG